MVKRAVVTGAYGGIGKATASRLSAVGFEVHAIDKDPGILSAQLQGVAERHLCDVSSPDQIKEVCATILAGGGVDALVNGAGVVTPGHAVDGAVADFDRSFEVNVRAPWLFAQQFIPAMQSLGGGSIVNIASAAALRPPSERLFYSASKAALVQLTRSIALDFARDNIRANALCPGSVDTAFLRSTKPSHVDVEAFLEEVALAYPMRRLGTLDEIASTVEFLVSDGAAYITGAALAIDGGRTLH